MKKDILQDLMEKHSSESNILNLYGLGQKELMVVREKISTAKKSLAKCSDQVQATSEEL